MARYAVDIESNGLLDTMTLIHTIHCVDLDTKVFHRADNRTGTDYTEINAMVAQLQDAEMLVFQNGFEFDIPAIKMLFPEFSITTHQRKEKGKPYLYDTKVASRVLYPDLRGADYGKFRKRGVPDYLKGWHSLEAWGYRLGDYKGDYGKDAQGNAIAGCWDEWNQEMSDYCKQDIRVTANLWQHLERYREEIGMSEESMSMEMDVAYIIAEQCEYGVYLDIDRVNELACEMSGRKAELEVELAKTMLPVEKFEKYTCKKNNSKAEWTEGIKLDRIKDKSTITTVEVNKGYRTVRRKGYEKGKAYWRIKTIPFSPTSRDHIIWNLKAKYGWKPTVFTDKGKPKMDEKTMGSLPYPEGDTLGEIFMLSKRLSQMTDGKGSWLNFYDPETKRVYPNINTCGTISARMSHSKPNMSQVPSAKKPYGHECRECWGVNWEDDGRVQVGCDASGIQLRMLAHYLARWDDGEYAEQILKGDIHAFNRVQAGLPERDMAKTFIYGWLFGAGDEKVGKIVNKGRQEGAKLKEQFMDSLPQVRKLMTAVKRQVDRNGEIRALDGRPIMIRSAHSALNFLLQSAEAMVMKKALVLAYHHMQDLELDFHFILNAHDEVQVDTIPADCVFVGETIRKSIIEAGEFFKLRIPMDGEYKLGVNWNHCH